MNVKNVYSKVTIYMYLKILAFLYLTYRNQAFKTQNIPSISLKYKCNYKKMQFIAMLNCQMVTREGE